MNKLKVVLLSLLIFNFSKVSALNVDVFPLLEFRDGISANSTQYEMILKSQHALMLYLKENSGSTVFAQSNFTNLTENEIFLSSDIDFISYKIERKNLKNKFETTSFPDFYEDFTQNQKDLLMKKGNALVLMFYLGYVKEILATCDEKQFIDWVNSLSTSESTYFMLKKDKNSSNEDTESALEAIKDNYKDQELAALDKIEEFRLKNPDVNSVTLVFNGMHDLEQYSAHYPNLKIRKINLKRYQNYKADFFKDMGMTPFEREMKMRRYDPYYFDPVTGTYRMRGTDF